VNSDTLTHLANGVRQGGGDVIECGRDDRLPSDIETLRRLLEAERQRHAAELEQASLQVQTRDRQIDRLTAIIKALQRHRLGQRSEQLDQRWPRESGQSAKWSFRLNAARMPRIRRDHGQANETEPHSGVQGKSGAGGFEGREDAGGAGAVFRCAS
jgi:hypothetical protein